MARETFISYKYADVVKGHENDNLRERIIGSLKDDAKFYRGERGLSDDLSSKSADYIWEYLKDMIFGTSVTIVIMSPNMRMSGWMERELSYSLKKERRGVTTSLANGLVAVVQKRFPSYMNDGYSWFRKGLTGDWDFDRTFGLIRENTGNRLSGAPSGLSPNYIDIVTEDTFLRNPGKYIEDAYNKKQNIRWFDVSKQP